MSKIKYFKQFILCGDLGYRCLLCKETCSSSDNVEKHLLWEKHRKALKTQTSMPQFSKDSIYKIDPYYYCTFCNRTMVDIAEVKQHIDSDIHKNYKSHPTAATTRVEVKQIDDDDNIYIKNTPISFLQWQGIIDNQCVLCNVALKSNMSTHLYSSDHIVKLLQTRVKDVDDKYYRKTDKNTFQCFTCKKTFSILEFDNHFINHSNNNTVDAPSTSTVNRNVTLIKDEPKVFDKDGNILKDCTMADANEKYPTVVCGSGMEKIRGTEWDIQLIAGLSDEYFDIDMELKKLTCRTCKKLIKITAVEISCHLYSHGVYHTNCSAVYQAISNHINKSYVQRNFDHGAARSKTAKYGQENHIKLNAGGSKGYCTLCDKFLTASIDVFKGHTAGRFHKGHLELKGIEQPRKHERGSYRPVLMMELIKTLSYSADKKAFLINESVLVNEDSFFLMKRIEHGKYYIKTKCFACDETLLPEEEKEHCVSWKHKSNLLAAKSISQDRFTMREIRPRLYHCGVCNESLPYWESYIKHTKMFTHEIKYNETVSAMVIFSFRKPIVLETNQDNLYMQLLNAVFNTKYVIKLGS